MELRLFLAAFLIIQLAVGSLAQQPQPSPPKAQPETPSPTQQTPQSGDDVVRITTNLVQLDAVVTDSKGRVVTDLRPEEFDILEDGRSQKITNLSYVSLESNEITRSQPATAEDKTGLPLPPVRLQPDQVRRTMALVVDDLGLSFESTYFVREALKKFIDKQMQANDLVAIIRTSGGIGALQQFTSDKRQLYAAVEKVKWTPHGRGGISAFAPLAADPLADRRTDEQTVERTGVEEVDQLREDLFAVGTLGALNYVVRGLRDLPGRKAVLLISDGLKIFNSSDPSRGSRILSRLRSLTDLANRASVVIYTIDARGLPVFGLTAADNTFGMDADQVERGLSDRSSSFFESQQGLIYLAKQTGGVAIRNSNDLNKGINRVIEDQKGYYLIGYRPDDSTFDQVSGHRKFHKLSLKVKRPGKFTVRMRSGFYGVTDEERVPPKLTPVQRMVGALVSPFGAAGVRLRLTSLFANDPKLGTIMRSFLHIDGRDLTFTKDEDDWQKVVFDIMAITFGDNGVVVDELSRTQTVRLRGKILERVKKDGFTYNLNVPIKKAGAYQLRTALRDNGSDRVGAATQFIEVPNVKKNRLVVSGILLKGSTLESFNKKVSNPSQEAASGESAEETTPPGAGVALRRFERGMVMEYGFAIYNAQLDAGGKPQVQTQVRLFRNGQQIFSGEVKPLDTTNQPDLKRLAAGGAMQLGAEMQPGEYVLQVIVTDPLAKEKHRVATQWIDFEIVK
ncbi:MAG TPA: VWA domain-containing protein [Pyrinomonadaceae bacterium]|nr:VWA domain-containing protein [Pyrinomonadaceae bacterium]